MAVKKLNLTMPHATVVGHPFFAYKQGDHYYNNDGIAVDESGKLLPTETGPAKIPSKAFKEPEPDTPDPDDEIDEEKVDLRGWADGIVSYPWGTVTAAIQREYDVVVKNKKEAIEIVNERSPAVTATVGAAPV